MKIINRWVKGDFEYVETEISPGHRTIGKYPVKKVVKKVKKTEE